MMTEQEPAYLTPTQFAEEMEVARYTVLRWIQDGDLPAVRLSPRAWMIPRAAAEEFKAGYVRYMRRNPSRDD